MKKHDTFIYKFKACATAAVLCGLFTVFAVGCSQKTYSESPQQSANISSSSNSASIDFSGIELQTRITFPEMSDAEPDPSHIRTIDSIDDVTMGQLSLGEPTIPDDETTSVPIIAIFENEKTETKAPFSRETMATLEGVFVIGEDTTATMVYGFN